MHVEVHSVGFLFNDFPSCCVGFLKAELLNALILSGCIWIFLEKKLLWDYDIKFLSQSFIFRKWLEEKDVSVLWCLKLSPIYLFIHSFEHFSNLHPVPTPGLDLGLQRTWQGEETWICEKHIITGLSAEYFDYLVNLILPTFQNLGLLTHGGLANSLIPQWLTRPKVHFLLILNGSCKGCGLMGALLWVLSPLRVQAEREPFLGLSLSCGWEVLLWPRQAMVPRCSTRLLRWDTCHFQLPKQVTWPTQGLWTEKHASLMGCTVSHTGVARDVCYCYRKGEHLAGRRDIIHHSIPSSSYKWPKRNQSAKYFNQNCTASECQRQDVNSVLCDCTFHLFTIHHVNIYDALCQ